jgi:hypothetical protein
MPEELMSYVYRIFPKYVNFDKVQIVLSDLKLEVNAGSTSNFLILGYKVKCEGLPHQLEKF